MKRKDVEKTRKKKEDIALDGILRALDYIKPNEVAKIMLARERAADMKQRGFNDLWIIAETGVWVGGEA